MPCVIRRQVRPGSKGIGLVKLVKLARLLSAKVLTNDFNLSKIAELEGVAVLNVHALANSLRPVVLPGEALDVARRLADWAIVPDDAVPTPSNKTKDSP